MAIPIVPKSTTVPITTWTPGKSHVYDRTLEKPRPVHVDPETGLSTESADTTAGVQYLTEGQRDGMEALVQGTRAMHEQAKSMVGKTEERFASLMELAQSGGELRRSDLLELKGSGTEVVASHAMVGAAEANIQQAGVQQAAFADGKLTAQERQGIGEVSAAGAEVLGQAEELTGKASELKEQAAVARAEEMGQDLEGVKAAMAQTDYGALKEAYKGAKYKYDLAVQEAGGPAAARDLTGEARVKLEGLEANKDAALKDLLAHNRTGVVVKNAEAAVLTGKVTAEQGTEFLQQCKAIGGLRTEAAQVRQGAATQQRGFVVDQALASGDLRKLFDTAEGRSLVMEQVALSFLAAQGFPFFSSGQLPGMDDAHGRAIYDMVSVLGRQDYGTAFGSNIYDLVGAQDGYESFPYNPRMMDFSSFFF